MMFNGNSAYGCDSDASINGDSAASITSRGRLRFRSLLDWVAAANVAAAVQIEGNQP